MKLSFLMLAFNDERCIDMSLSSALEHGDEVIIVDGGSSDKTVGVIKWFIKNHKKGSCIKFFDGPVVNSKAYKDRLFDKFGRCYQNGSFGEMKQFAYEQASGDYVFFLDSDECVCDEARRILDELSTKELDVDGFNVQYVHFVGDFSHVDNSEGWHNGMLRFHKNIKSIKYSGRYNHAVAHGNKNVGTLFNLTIFHLGYAMNMFDVFERYKRNMIYSEMHFGIYQCIWRDWHYYSYPKVKLPLVSGNDVLFGACGKKPSISFPKALINRFEMDVFNNTDRGKFNPEEAKR